MRTHVPRDRDRRTAPYPLDGFTALRVRWALNLDTSQNREEKTSREKTRSAVARAFNATRGGGRRSNGFNTFAGLPPVYMVHLAGLRLGAWHRRAVLRAHGWWHPPADVLAARQLKWGQRRGYLTTPVGITRAATKARGAPRAPLVRRARRAERHVPL